MSRQEDEWGDRARELRRAADASQDEWLAMVRQAKAVEDRATAYKNQIMRKAFEMGVNRDDLATALGISRARLYQIIDGK